MATVCTPKQDHGFRRRRLARIATSKERGPLTRAGAISNCAQIAQPLIVTELAALHNRPYVRFWLDGSALP